MADEREVDICVIGAGAAGLSVAAGAAQMGASTVLVEKGEMGGECLNLGCVPSKALLASARAAALASRAPSLGVRLDGASVDFADVSKHVHATIAAIAPNDSVERFEGLGVKVIRGSARFVSPRAIEVNGVRIGARRFVLATGSGPQVPPIPGLAKAGYLTNETVFDLTRLPEHLIVIGGGPIGVEMAQAFRQLGARVSVLEQFSILARDDPELTGVVRDRLADDGVEVREGATVTRVQRSDGRVVVAVRDSDGAEDTVEGSHILVATGRRARVDGLGLESAGIAFDADGVKVDARLRTDNRRVFAIGDVIRGGHRFTHMCTYHAAIVIRNALFRIPAKVRLDAFPWVTFTTPELRPSRSDRATSGRKGGRNPNPSLAVRGRRPRARRSRDRRACQGGGDAPGPHSRRRHRRPARRRAHPVLGSRDPGGARRKRDRQDGVSLSYLRRGQQTRRRQLLRPRRCSARERAGSSDGCAIWVDAGQWPSARAGAV